MDDVLAEATKKGMYLVDHNNTDPLLEEYEDAMMEADQLCDIADPVTAPFESKYKARKLLDEIINKLDATRAIASLERNTATIDAVDFRLAAAKVKVGTISWECEEPHNAQTDLELACQYYFPGLVEKITELSKEDEVDEAGPQPGETEKPFTSADLKEPPVLPILKETLVMDAMRALNILGIVWAGRAQVHKSMLYLLAAQQFYLTNIKAPCTTPGQTSRFTRKVANELGSTYTHTLFYLAQAYGNIGDTHKSCMYCHMTLQRQFGEGFKEIHGALDWAKNCSSIADFYLAMGQYNNCALALASAEAVVKKHVIPRIHASDPAEVRAIVVEGGVNTNYVSGNLNAAEIEADIHRKWAMLDVSVLRKAFERAKTIENAIQMGLNLADIEAQMAQEEGPPSAEDFDIVAHHHALEQAQRDAAAQAATLASIAAVSTAHGAGISGVDEDINNHNLPSPPPPPPAGSDVYMDQAQRDAAAQAATLASIAAVSTAHGAGISGIDEEVNNHNLPSPPAPPSATATAASVSSATAPKAPVDTVEFFCGLPVKPTLGLNRNDVFDFETARKAFLRAAGRIEASKKYYVLDGTAQ
jgi:DNA-binding transcriptional MerR regulator